MENTKAKITELKSNQKTLFDFKNSKLSLGLLSLFIISVIGAIVWISTIIGENYAKRIQMDNQAIREIASQRAAFAVKKIILKKNGQVYEISDNGLIISYLESMSNIINNRKFISNSRLSNLLQNMTEEEFLNLLAGYYTDGEAYTLTIETTNGSKTIIFNNENTNTPPDVIEDIVDETEEIIDELDDPQPTPPQVAPTPTPSASPPPSSTPNPTSTPTPPPGGSPATIQPFSCDMLQNQINDVTVSNTVCIP